MPSKSYHLPRSLVILKSLSMSVLAAGLPRQSMISGLTASICPCKYGLQASISPVLGWRFFIAPPSLTAVLHLTICVRYTSCLVRFTAARMSSRSLPARPTNGRPVASSFSPGPSPTSIRGENGSPVPKTVFVRLSARSHLVHTETCRASSASLSSRSSPPSKELKRLSKTPPDYHRLIYTFYRHITKHGDRPIISWANKRTKRGRRVLTLPCLDLESRVQIPGTEKSRWATSSCAARRRTSECPSPGAERWRQAGSHHNRRSPEH